MGYSEIQERREDSWRFLGKEGACPLLGSLHVHGARIQTTGMWPSQLRAYFSAALEGGLSGASANNSVTIFIALKVRSGTPGL